LRNRREAEKNVIALRSSINAEVGTPKSVCDLAADYRPHELTRERKAFSTIENHRVPRNSSERTACFHLTLLDWRDQPAMTECALLRINREET
jgi:hypothetical protein